MRFYFALILLIVLAPLSLAQNAQLRIAVEGRGNIVIKLFTREAPKTTAQIIRLAKQGFYDGQRFHKVVRSPKPFIIQLGAPGSRSKSMDDASLANEGSGSTVPYEDSGYKHNEVGMVGLAAPQNNRNGGDSQFYILLDPNTFLDGNYTVFGKVVQGMDILNKIEKGDRVVSVTVVGG